MSSTNLDVLFTPVQIGSATSKNRIHMSALTRSRAPGTIPTDVMGEYYKQRATEGAGLIVSEGILIVRQGFVDYILSPRSRCSDIY
jgi:2,4-dienoyl-CoA reductase-like NADH-dependent reductase (Old Yellow Enzyme family)